ncbi:hypothetical protein SAMN05880501_102158 [Ureibacillus xyleni]|uniref:Uncharacterized protein n=1 Tax=Ureibacillus xyleni TaxID=614648 RepID=A0A285RXK9_9BACL|nr:hypothetical protein SAMN05880501_102158 [Ureibacillus xyleni]
MHPAFGHGKVNDYRQYDDQFARAIEDYKDVRDQLEILM